MMKKGFTIIESLVAISILVLAVMGTMSAVQSGLSSYIYSKDQITAFYLAQEGFEQIKNIRDENNLEGTHWLSGIAEADDPEDGPCFFGYVCKVSPVETTLATRCGNDPDSCPVLRQDTVNGFYGYNPAPTWTDTIYRREIELKKLEPLNENEVTVIVTVYWSKGLTNRQFRVKENIFNWQSGTLEP